MDDPIHIEKFNHNVGKDLQVNVADLGCTRGQDVDYFLVLDLEGKVEILEFPVLIVDARTLNIADSFHRCYSSFFQIVSYACICYNTIMFGSLNNLL